MLGRHIRCQEALILSFTSKFSRFKRILREAYLVLQNKWLTAVAQPFSETYLAASVLILLRLKSSKFWMHYSTVHFKVASYMSPFKREARWIYGKSRFVRLADSLQSNIVFFPREEREELIKIARDKASEEICLMVLNEGVLIELQNLALEVLDEKKAERDSKLHQLAVKVKRSRTARYFSRYKIL